MDTHAFTMHLLLVDVWNGEANGLFNENNALNPFLIKDLSINTCGRVSLINEEKKKDLCSLEFVTPTLHANPTPQY